MKPSWLIACCLCLAAGSTGCRWDRPPSRLSDNVETIEVSYVNWACDCPDWIETKYSRDSTEIDERQCIYVEPAQPAIAITDSFYTTKHFSQTLRLSGRFYLDEGVPASYEQKTSGKSEPGKVFCYDKIEYIDR